jgi:transposase-like protein
MSNYVKPSKGITCPSCRCNCIRASSAHDGRPLYKCDVCGRSWTNGRKLGQGYKWKQELCEDKKWTEYFKKHKMI